MGDMYYSSKRSIKRIPKVIVVLIVAIIIAFAIIGIRYIASHWDSISSIFQEKEPVAELASVPEPKMFMGINIDSLDVQTYKVEKNSTLGDILSPYGVSAQKIHQLATFNTELFDPRHIKSGNDYITITSRDSIPELLYFIYSESLIDFVVCNLRDSIKMNLFSKEVTTHQRQISGKINSSLYMTIVESGAREDLAYHIADVYQWTIDFYDVQKGDAFAVIYEELMVDSTVVGINQIIASKFEHIGKTYYAFGYSDSNTKGFWDESGESLKKTFLKAPLQFSRVSSRFSYARRHPVTKKVQPHLGVDYAAPTGTPVWAVADGVVIRRSYDNLNGNYIRIKHSVRGGRYETGYLHLSRFAKGLTVGSRVTQGEVIGYVGSTGRSTGAHLDFRIWENGKAINPLKMTQEKGVPITESSLEGYNIYKDSVMNVLNSIEIR